MRFAVGSVILGLALLASHPAAADYAHGPFRPPGDVMILPLASGAPTAAPSVTVNASSSTPPPSSNHTISTAPAYGNGENAAAGVATTGAGTTAVYYEGQSCDADIFSQGDDDDGEGGCGGSSERRWRRLLGSAEHFRSEQERRRLTTTRAARRLTREGHGATTMTKEQRRRRQLETGAGDGTSHKLNVAPKLYGTHATNDAGAHAGRSSPAQPLRAPRRRARDPAPPPPLEGVESANGDPAGPRDVVASGACTSSLRGLRAESARPSRANISRAGPRSRSSLAAKPTSRKSPPRAQTARTSSRPISPIPTQRGRGSTTPSARSGRSTCSSTTPAVQIVKQVTATEWSDAEMLLRLDLLVPLRLTTLVLRGMIPRRTGTIVDIASMAALGPTPGMFFYNAAKAGLAAASEGLRAEMKPHGIHIVTVYPGPVTSDMEAAGRAAYEEGAIPVMSPTGTPGCSRT